jgi:hypothetical protein
MKGPPDAQLLLVHCSVHAHDVALLAVGVVTPPVIPPPVVISPPVVIPAPAVISRPVVVPPACV